MKFLLENPLTKFSMVSGLGILFLLSLIFFQSIRTSQPVNKSQIPSLTIQHAKVKIPSIPLEKLQYKPKFVAHNTAPTIRFVPNQKHTSNKTKVLQKVLKNDQKRKKFEYVVKKASELKLPAELALIPVIESEYNTRAVSYAGAGGLWQLMPGTARIFGVSSQQRFEMKPSTKAALLYLKKLHKKFGNWDFAIAAYNAGDGKVSRALRRNSSAKSIKDLHLPRETRNYVLSFNQLKKQVQFST